MSETSAAGNLIADRVRAEIQRLHAFLAGWFNGRVDAAGDVFEREFVQYFESGAVLVLPGGAMVTSDELARSIRGRHGSNPDFRIAIRNIVIRGIFGRHVLATYEEWQRSARASAPPDNGRLTSVILRSGDVVKWAHVHETWLPADIMSAGPYDF